MFFALMMMLTASVSANAMSYEQARNEALFLTDKMAYELNLTDEQYEAAYEINLDYLMGVTSRYDVYGTYWERRNLDLSYILLDWQWNAFVAASYFYRPLYWDAGYWHFGIYARYPHRDYFYFGRPHFYHSYRGAHAWHRVGGHGYYHGHSSHYRHHREHIGMHDRWNRGEFRGGNRHSSTRVTAGNREGRGIGHGNRSIERQNRSIERGNRTIERQNRTIERGNRTIERQNRTIERGNRTIERGNRTIGHQNGSIDRSRRSSTYGSSRGSSFGSSRSSSYGSSRNSSFGSSRSGSYGGSRSSSFGSSHSGGSRSGSFGGGSHSSSRSGGSFSGGSHGGGHSGGHGGGHGGGGGRMGGHR